MAPQSLILRNFKMQQNRLEILAKVLIKISIMIIAGYFFLSIFFLSYYVHEGGHILFGQLNNLILEGKLSKIVISNWINYPLIPFLKLPQQTRILEGKGSLNFIFGGIFLSILISIFVAWIGYKQSKDKLWFLLPLPIITHEIFGNYFCGTDNLQNNPLAICQELSFDIFTKISLWIFVAILLVIFYKSKSYKRICNFFLKIGKPKRYKQITTLKEININDPLKEKKIMYLNGVNRLSDLINSLQRDTENKILLFVSIIFSGSLGAFLTAKMYLESIFMAGILLLLLLIAIIKESNNKRKLYNQLNRVVKDAKEKAGLDLRQ